MWWGEGGGSGWRWGGWEGRRSLSGVEVASAKAGGAEEQRSRRPRGKAEGPGPVLVGVWVSGREWKRQADL